MTEFAVKIIGGLIVIGVLVGGGAAAGIDFLEDGWNATTEFVGDLFT